ncbi:MAG: hypothetical protein AABM40_09625 [Chloroflexota bacterium]
MSTEQQLILFGGVAALFPDVLRLIKQRYEPPAEYWRRPVFWISLVAMVIVGAIATWLSKPDSVVAALSVGYAAPEVLSRLLSAPPDPARGVPPPGGPGLREHWAS